MTAQTPPKQDPAEQVPDESSQTQADTPQEDDRSFVEVLFTDAINPGVHKQSLDAANYALLALFIVGGIALVLHNFSIHYIILLLLAFGLAGLLNHYREDIIAASQAFMEAEAQREQEADEQEFIETEEQQNDSDDPSVKKKVD